MLDSIMIESGLGKEKQDYSEDMIGILLGMFKSLTEIESIKYQEGIK